MKAEVSAEFQRKKAGSMDKHQTTVSILVLSAILYLSCRLLLNEKHKRNGPRLIARGDGNRRETLGNRDSMHVIIRARSTFPTDPINPITLGDTPSPFLKHTRLPLVSFESLRLVESRPLALREMVGCNAKDQQR